MGLVDITLSGCDDSTRLFDVELTEAEFATVTRIAALSVEASDYNCMPIMRIAQSPLATPADATCGNCYGPIADGSRKRDKYGDWIHETCPEAAS